MSDIVYESWDKKFFAIRTDQAASYILKNFTKHFDIYEKLTYNDTSTYGGLQEYFKDNEALDAEEFLTKLVNKKFQEHNFSLKLTGNPLDNSTRSSMKSSRWRIKYLSGGWQALHSHQPFDDMENHTIISVVMYFDTPGPSHMDGSFISVFPDKDGKVNWQEIVPKPGTILIMSGNLVHGAYPTTVERKIIVMDFIAEKIKNES